MSRLRTAGSVFVLGLLSGSASAADLEERLGRIEEAIDAAVDRAAALDQRLAATTGTLDETRAVERYQDAVYQHMVGADESAAEVFFVLVASGVLERVGLQREGEWYLGEALLGAGHDDMAEAVFADVIAKREHPFRADAVRRLLEVYSEDADPARFDQLFQREIVQGGVEPTDLILYAVGKALKRKGEAAKAKAYLSELGPDSPYWARARYQLGAMLVAQGDEAALRDAVIVFRELSLLQDPSAEDASVRDLSLLALGRLHDHFGESERAIFAYESLMPDSPYRSAQLRELAWLYIRLAVPGLALDAVDRFLGEFPDHADAAELRLVRAQLMFRRGDWERALDTYEDVVASYVPVRDRFTRLAGTGGSPRAYLDDVLGDLGVAEDDGANTADPLPGYALAVMREDAALVDALALLDEVEGTVAALEAAEGLVAELQLAFAEDSSRIVQLARFASVDGRLQGVALRLDLLDVEAGWLRQRGVGEVEAQLVPLREQRETVRARLPPLVQQAARARQAGDAAEEGGLVALEGTGGGLAEVERMVDDLVESHRSLRSQVGVELDPTSTRLDSLLASLNGAVARVVAAASAFAEADAGGLSAADEVFRRESEAVRAERADVGREGTRVDDLSTQVVRSNLERLAQLFGRRVVAAEMGAVNVHWSRWVEAGESREAVADERSRTLAELEREYELIERRLGR